MSLDTVAGNIINNAHSELSFYRSGVTTGQCRACFFVWGIVTESELTSEDCDQFDRTSCRTGASLEFVGAPVRRSVRLAPRLLLDLSRISCPCYSIPTLSLRPARLSPLSPPLRHSLDVHRQGAEREGKGPS